ncbi:MAG: hypothetical protein KIS86_15565 [Devosia sp.]|nr:hypothetical protein [Devosia sp.]
MSAASAQPALRGDAAEASIAALVFARRVRAIDPASAWTARISPAVTLMGELPA